MKKNQIVEINLRHPHSDGSYRWISWRINKNADELICGIGQEIILNKLQDELEYQSYLDSDKSTYQLIDSVSQKVELFKKKLQQTQQKIDSIKSEYKQNSNTVINQNSNSSYIVDFYELEKQIEDAHSYEKLLQSLFIAQEENNLDKIIANVPQGILLLDSECKIILANQNGRDNLKLIAEIDSNNIVTKRGGEAIEE